MAYPAGIDLVLVHVAAAKAKRAEEKKAKEAANPPKPKEETETRSVTWQGRSVTNALASRVPTDTIKQHYEPQKGFDTEYANAMCDNGVNGIPICKCFVVFASFFHVFPTFCSQKVQREGRGARNRKAVAASARGGLFLSEGEG